MSVSEPPFGPAAPPGTGLTPLPPGAPGSPAVVAFYLPQYHQIPENDEWWGEGFTDWVNVAAARPLYPGHPVPYVPAGLGAYDLRSREVRASQAELARLHGVFGFCYYFYWFGGLRLLEQPLELMLRDGQPDLPFCLCWANEPWTRRWDGRESDILMPQHHDRVRDLAILDDLVPFFEDPRYIRIDGRPLLLVYRQGLMPEAPGFAADLRAEATRRGLPGLFLCNVLSIGDGDRCAPGFDAAVEFPPQGTLGREIRPRSLGADPAFKGHIYDYESTVRTAIARPAPSFPSFPGVMPRWDNTARKGMRAHIFHGSTPELFERWLRRASLDTRRRNPGAPLVFVNAWNEWAEGAHLEPDERVGRRNLEVVRETVYHASDEIAGRDLTTDVSRPDDQAAVAGHAVEAKQALAGWPDEAIHRDDADGSAWIEEADGCPPQTHEVRAGPGRPLRLRGWYHGDWRRGGRVTDRRYLVLSSGGSVWRAEINQWERRPDLLRAMLGLGLWSRRMVRAIDRLPPRAGYLALSLWARGRDWFGFDVCLGLDDVPGGTWAIGIAETTPFDDRLVDTGFVLRHQRIP